MNRFEKEPETAMTAELYAVTVPDLATVFLGVACENYTAADLAVWKARTAIGDRDLTPRETGMIQSLNARRRQAYNDLVSWIDLTEAARIQSEKLL